MFDWYWAFLFGYMLHLLVGSMVSIHLHRVYSHRQLKSTESLDTFCRICLWSAGYYWPMMARSFAAVHRKHHNNADTDIDPHTPLKFSCRELVFPKWPFTKEGPYYMPDNERDEIAGDVPAFNDRLDKFFLKYKKYSTVPWLVVYLVLFSWPGVLVGFAWLWVTKHLWRLHNCVSHSHGYRWQPPKSDGDLSKNILPVGVFFAGEELAANHHDYPFMPNFAIKWYEFDPTWHVVRLLRFFKLVEVIERK